MRFRFVSATILIATAVLAGCATKPQLPVDLSADTLSPARKESVGVAIAKLPKPSLELPGAGCLLCIVAAKAMNASLSQHTDTLSSDEIVSVREQIAAALRKKGVKAQVIAEQIEIDKLAEKAASDDNSNAARRDFTPLKQKFGVDKLIVVEVKSLGFERSYSAYIPNGDPKSVLRGTGYMVDLSKNTLDWYLPVVVTKSADGAWDEPAQFPGLTNAYFQTIELARDRLVQPFKQ